MSTYRLGIIGTGNIAHRFVPEARTIENITITAVYNPRYISAERFAKEFQIEYATDDVNAFIQKVDIVYIATPHETHADYARQMLEAGKHVLCEKPMSFSKTEAESLFQLAKEKNRVLMEGMKTAYCPGFNALLEVVNSGKIGRVVDVEACFSRLSKTNVREMWDMEYGGCFTEFGTYPLLPIVKLLGTKAKSSHIWALEGKTGVDIYTKTSFVADGATALAKTGLAVKSEGQLVIAGTKGYVLVPSPWWLTKYFEVRYEDPNVIEKYEYPYEGQGLRYELQELVERIEGTSEESLMAEESIWFAEQMEWYMSESAKREKVVAEENTGAEPMKFWAHRGCSMEYPENTLSAFEAAAKVDGITGVELDIHLSWDDVMVVIHDETVDRTTNGIGKVNELSLKSLKALEIKGKDGVIERIPTIEEVFQLLKPYCVEKGLLINIELKNNKNRYEGMEKKILAMVKRYELEPYVIYSSFRAESMGLLKELDSTVHTGILGRSMSLCAEKAQQMKADAIHPWIGEMDVCDEIEIVDMPIRVWNVEEPLFGQDKILKETNLTKYRKLGATDIITNVPELYLKNNK